MLYVAAVCDHIPSLNSTFDSYGALQWRPAAPTSCHQNDRRQLSPYIWRPLGLHMSTRPTSLTEFFEERRNRVPLATQAGKVKRVSLEMTLRKSAKQHCRMKKMKASSMTHRLLVMDVMLRYVMFIIMLKVLCFFFSLIKITKSGTDYPY